MDLSKWNWNTPVKFERLPERVRKDLVEAHSEVVYSLIPQEERDKIVREHLQDLTAFEAIDQFLTYNGTIGFTGTITTLITGVIQASEEK